ncbi:acyltransferase family protein [Jiangella alkaliphila]|uniref:Peptidoglycan/LPS O-acetylase OafA/YrhL, contains acyltransferase and SGNH-hydrolase domains n=1 Tax=Jiangella alkaliphila TaxID=419479 RepID=A0A1H2LZV5_9ACTN|nr:Peptidoglycan/LPS O-acetylase OafA/YrhL, contains acyltransferase and SGNH-hydrolase domains [Jiangella alkaliphila]
MRAVAVVLVLLYHASPGIVPGGFVGVDVFFVISGFLITGMLVRELEQSGTVSLARFYARRAKRLLPASVLVLVLTAVAAWLMVPAVDRRPFGGDIAASALYFVNWRLADRSVDYLAEGVGTSPVQHFWSLAVEEQFYLLWPLFILAIAAWTRRAGEPARPWLAVGLIVVALPSFAWSVIMTMTNPSAAFFVSTTRLWELAAGAGVALALPALERLPERFAAALAWAGLGAVVLSAFVVTTGTAWPGAAALLPVAGTAAVIAGGVAARRRGPVTVLGIPLLVGIGALSYSLYLWHWPMLVLAEAQWGDLSTGQALGMVAASFVPAWLAYRFVENPVRHAGAMVRSPRFALSIGANLSLAGVVAGLALVAAVPSATSATEPAAPPPGAAVLDLENPRDDPDGRPVDEVGSITPDPLDAPEDVPPAYADGCQVGIDSTEVATCEYGDPDGEVTIALVGDSKALQWITALDTIGRTNGWRVVTYTKSTCSFTAATLGRDGEPFEACTEWNDAVVDRLRDLRPDLVLTSQGRNRAMDDPEDPDAGESHDAMVEGLVRRWTDLSDEDIPVAVLADTPQPGFDVYECAAEHRDRLTECSFDRAEAVANSAAAVLERAAEESGRVAWINLNRAICPGESCAPVIGNVLVYRQGSHLTVTYVDTLEPRLARALEEIVP